uniref:Secreted protein n=1 Tax=Ixodes ricinus TaxID=34613 RepID=A0A6B0UT49_IXORI
MSTVSRLSPLIWATIFSSVMSCLQGLSSESSGTWACRLSCLRGRTSSAGPQLLTTCSQADACCSCGGAEHRAQGMFSGTRCTQAEDRHPCPARLLVVGSQAALWDMLLAVAVVLVVVHPPRYTPPPSPSKKPTDGL